MIDAAPLREALRQLAEVVAGLDASRYASPPPGLGPGTVGSHVRHCLDHVQALIDATEGGRLDYDRRRRGSAMETDQDAALREMERLDRLLAGLPARVMGRAVTVVCLLDPARPAATLDSTLGRETAYVLSHTTHHNAIIGCLVRAMGGATPARFGYAAATLAAMEAGACAR